MPDSRNPKLLPHDKGIFPSQSFGGVKGATHYIYDVGAYQEDWHKKSLVDGRRGMWVLRFPASSKELNGAWRAVENRIEKGVFMEAGFSKNNPHDKEQVIIIPTYDYNDITDVRMVHEQILQHHINEHALNKDDLQYYTEAEFGLYFKANPIAKYSSRNLLSGDCDLSGKSKTDNPAANSHPPSSDDAQMARNIRDEIENENKDKSNPEFQEINPYDKVDASVAGYLAKIDRYILNRQVEEKERKNPHGFFAKVSTMMSELSEKVTRMTTETKIQAAEKLKDAIINPHKNITFSYDEVRALSNDKLGDVIKQIPENILPKQFLAAVKEDVSNLNRPRW